MGAVLLQARFAVVDALRCWLDGGWRPELVPALFVSPNTPAAFDLPPTIAQARGSHCFPLSCIR